VVPMAVLGRSGDGDNGGGSQGDGGGGVWSRRRFPGAAVKAERTMWFPGAVMKARRMARLRARSGGRRGGCTVEVDVEELTGLGFTGSNTLKKKNSSDGQGCLRQHVYR
jgi:hypothetical protein